MKELVLTGYLVVLSVFDGRERKVPVSLLCAGTLLAGVWVAWDCLNNSLLGQRIVLTAALGMIPGAFMLLMAYVTHKVGYGDGLALLSVGIFIGYKECWRILCISLVLMSFWSIGVLVLRKGTRNTRIPYLPFLTLAYLLDIFAKGG